MIVICHLQLFIWSLKGSGVITFLKSSQLSTERGPGKRESVSQNSGRGFELGVVVCFRTTHRILTQSQQNIVCDPLSRNPQNCSLAEGFQEFSMLHYIFDHTNQTFGIDKIHEMSQCGNFFFILKFVNSKFPSEDIKSQKF